MKLLPKVVSAIYLLLLLWLVLFKFSLHIFEIFDFPVRGTNLIPFAGISQGSSLAEMGYNLLFFVPFGLLLSVNLKRATFRRKVAHVFFFSLALEAIQCIFAIGIADVTDVIMNTAGGLLGLALYGISRRYVDGKKLNKWTTITIGAVVVLLFAFVYSVQLAHNKHRPQLTAKAAFAHSPFSSRTTHKQEK